MSQHAGLSAERWSTFSLEQQILMIGNELNRGAKLFASEDRDRLRGCYERILRLTDLTIADQARPTLRRELLRWRDLVAELYLSADARRHEAAFRCLLRFTPASARQIPLLLGR